MSEYENELQDRFADAAMELFLNQYAQDEGEHLLKLYQDQQDADPVPDDLDRRCQSIIERTHKRTLMGSTLQRAARIAACILLALTLTFQVVLNVEAFRIPVLNYILKHGKGFTQISFSQNESSFSALDQLRVLIWTAMPDGYQMEYENVKTSKHLGTEAVSNILTRFENDQGNILEISVLKARGSFNIDSQDATVTSMELYGQQTVFIANDDTLRAIWVNESQQQMYDVIGNGTGPDAFWECVHTLAKATQNTKENISF